MNIVTQIRTRLNDDKVVLFSLNISAISAERQFDMSLLGLDVDSLPKDSRKLLQETIFPKGFLLNYTRLRDRAMAVLESGAAVKTIHGYITNRAEAVIKIKELNDIKADWEKQLTIDEAKYGDICRSRISALVEQAFNEGCSGEVVNTLVDAMTKRQPTWESFKSRMTISFVPTPITLDVSDNNHGFDPVLFQAQKDGVVALRDGVFGALIQNIVSEASAILKVLGGKQPNNGFFQINYRTVARINDITTKMHGLAYVHSQIEPVAKIIDDALAFIPQASGRDLELAPRDFYNLVACLNALSDQHQLLACLRTKTPLVKVTQEPTSAPKGVNSSPVAVATTQTNAAVAPAVAAVSAVGTATAKAVEETNVLTEPVVDQVAPAAAEASNPIGEEEEVAAVEQPSFMSFGFMGNSLFN